MATSTEKASIIHDSQMPHNLRPNFCSALENHDCPSAPTQPSQWCGIFHRLDFCSKPQRENAAEAVATNSHWSLISVLPNRWYIFTDCTSVGAWASP